MKKRPHGTFAERRLAKIERKAAAMGIEAQQTAELAALQQMREIEEMARKVAEMVMADAVHERGWWAVTFRKAALLLDPLGATSGARHQGSRARLGGNTKRVLG